MYGYPGPVLLTDTFQSGQKQQQQQFKDTTAVVAGATKQYGILQNIFFSMVPETVIRYDMELDKENIALLQVK